MIKGVKKVFESNDLHCEIFTFLTMRNVISCQLVNKLWNEHALNPASMVKFTFDHCYNYNYGTNLIKRFNIKDISRFDQCKIVEHYIDRQHVSPNKSRSRRADDLSEDSDDSDDSDDDSDDDLDEQRLTLSEEEAEKIRIENNLKLLKMCDQFANFTKIEHLTIVLYNHNVYDCTPYSAGLLLCIKKKCYDTIESLFIRNYHFKKSVNEQEKKAVSHLISPFLVTINYTRLKTLELNGFKLEKSFATQSYQFTRLHLINMILPLSFWDDLAQKMRNYNINRNGVNLRNLSTLRLINVDTMRIEKSVNENVFKDICCQLGNVARLTMYGIDYYFIEMFLYFLCMCSKNTNGLKLNRLSLKWNMTDQVGNYSNLVKYNYQLAQYAPDLQSLTLSLVKSTLNYLDLFCGILYKLLTVASIDHDVNTIKNENGNSIEISRLSNIERIQLYMDTEFETYWHKLSELFKKLEIIKFDKLRYFSYNFTPMDDIYAYNDCGFMSIQSILNAMKILDQFMTGYNHNNNNDNNDHVSTLFATNLSATPVPKYFHTTNHTFSQQEDSDIGQICKLLKKWYMNSLIQFDATFDFVLDKNKHRRFIELINSQIIDNDQFKQQVKKREKEIGTVKMHLNCDSARNCIIQYGSILEIQKLSCKDSQINLSVHNASIIPCELH